MSDEHHRANAAHAQKMADSSISDIDKASWLQIAQGWLGLIKFSAPDLKTQSASDKFDAQSDKDGTGQDGSESSH